jgi:hypothetical protein
MQLHLCSQRFLRVLGPPALYLAVCTSVIAAPTNIFFTQFEPGDGYSTDFDLVGQGGWLGEGSGGNGIVNNYIAGQGQQAYIGYDAPTAGNELFIWHPLKFDPLAAGLPIVKFSVLLNIIDSNPTPTTPNRDVFGWSVYNTQANRLFSIDFDNKWLDITYQLDGTNEVYVTGFAFTNDINYTLNVTMNFGANFWSASYNGNLIATNQPITTTGATLDLGDIDAEWLIYDASAPGDNYMLFDNYHVTAEAPTAQMEFLDRTDKGWALLRIFGDAGSRWAVEATTNLVNWTALKTNVVSDISFDLVDETAVGSKQRFYRARFVP